MRTAPALLAWTIVLIRVGQAAAVPTAETEKDLSGAFFQESLNPTAAVGGTVRAGSSSGFFSAPASAQRKGAGVKAEPPPPPPVDGYGKPRMIALVVGGFAAGLAAMIPLSQVALPFLAAGFLGPPAVAFGVLGAGFAVSRAVRGGTRGPKLILNALKGAALGVMMGPPLVGAWLGAQASELIDRVQNH